MKNLGWKALIGTVSAWLAIGSAQAQLVPEKPIRWLVPYAAGGASDMVARLVAQEMNTAAAAGNVFVIDNKPGAASIVASQILVQSKADGHTVMTASFDTLSANPNFFRKIPYRWDQDFAFIGFIAKLPLVLVARPDSGIAQADDFVQYMSQHAKSLSYATWGHGTISHLGIELLSNSAAATQLARSKSAACRNWPKPVKIASSGRPGVLSTLAVVTLLRCSSSSTKSVNVPPISTETENLGIFIVLISNGTKLR